VPEGAINRSEAVPRQPATLGLAVLTERLATRRLRYASLLGLRLVAAVANAAGPAALRRPLPEPFGGHYGVTRSLVHGLRGLDRCSSGLSWAYQPELGRCPAESAVVLSGVDVLRHALAHKREGRCGRLLAGPNLMILPDQHGGILVSEEIDAVLVPSEWVRTMYEQRSPALAGRIAVWAAGVDPTFWRPYGQARRRLVLIYNKLQRRRAQAVRDLVARLGHPTALVSYGTYSPARYRRLLNSSIAVVFLTESESQGLALAEAWAMDVPTFVIDNRQRLVGGRPVEVSTAPYLSAATGRFWSDPEELEICLSAPALSRFAPRDWMLDHMSDQVCARKLVAIALPEAAAHVSSTERKGTVIGASPLH
jgi:hypothetical protein